MRDLLIRIGCFALFVSPVAIASWYWAWPLPLCLIGGVVAGFLSKLLADEVISWME